jgi:hypothetical protein
VLARLRRLAGADNAAIARTLGVPPAKIAAVDRGREPPYGVGAALVALLHHIGGDIKGLD